MDDLVLLLAQAPELVGMHSADFADMLQNDPEIREAIRKIGGDLNALDTKLKSYVPGKPATGEAAVASPELLNAAGRLEAARSNSRIADTSRTEDQNPVVIRHGVPSE